MRDWHITMFQNSSMYFVPLTLLVIKIKRDIQRVTDIARVCSRDGMNHLFREAVLHNSTANAIWHCYTLTQI